MASEYYRAADTETRVRSVTHSFGLIIAALLLATLCVSVASAVAMAAGFSVESMASLPPVPYAALTAAQFVGFLLAGFAYLWWRDTDLFDFGFPSLRGLAWIVGGFVALYGLNLVVSVAFQWFGVEVATNRVVEQGQQDPTRFLLLIPVTILFVAPAEELLYRGIIQGLFRRAYGVVPGVVFASLLFGFGHWLALIGSGSGKVSYVVMAALLGLVLGALYEFSENLLVPIAVHGLYNALLFVGQYLVAIGAVSG